MAETLKKNALSNEAVCEKAHSEATETETTGNEAAYDKNPLDVNSTKEDLTHDSDPDLRDKQFTRISYTKKVKLMPPEFVESRRQYLHNERQANPDDVNGRMDPHYISVSYEDGTMTLRFETKEWEMNRVGILHGGITSTMLDHSAGSAVYTFLGHWCPTLDMDVRFISQAVLGDTLTCVGRVIHAGERFITAEAVLTNDTNGRLVATSLMTFANGADLAKGALDKGDRHEG